MRKILFMAVALAGVIFSGCKDDDIKETIDARGAIIVNVGENELPTSAGSVDFKVVSNTKWTLSIKESGVDWFSVDPKSSDLNKTVTGTYKVNDTGEDRTCTVVMNYGEGKTQEAIFFQHGLE